MFGFLKKLFGPGEAPEPERHDPVDYNGYSIIPTPRKESSGWRVEGLIEKQEGNRVLTYRFVRADIFISSEDTVQTIVMKAKRLVDEQGDKLFPKDEAPSETSEG